MIEEGLEQGTLEIVLDAEEIPIPIPDPVRSPPLSDENFEMRTPSPHWTFNDEYNRIRLASAQAEVDNVVDYGYDSDRSTRST